MPFFAKFCYKLQEVGPHFTNLSKKLLLGTMKTIFIILLLVKTAFAFEPESCKTVRLADIGWTDVTITTAIAGQLVKALGYEPKISLLSLPVTLSGLKNNDVDIFLGNWMPSQEADIRPFLNEQSIVQVKQNLTGAVYSLAVPQYVFDAGIKSLEDLDKVGKKFKKLIYGVEPGNDGNRLILKMIKDNAFGFRDWKIVESSEQAMLSEVKKAIEQEEYILFLAWSPHPMNLQKISYLSGGDNYFGPNFGAARVFTLSRKDLAKDCPNLNQLFTHLEFSVDMENELMTAILKGQKADEAAKDWLRNNPLVAQNWLLGVTTFNGEPANQALKNYLQNDVEKEQIFRMPLGKMAANGVTYLTSHFSLSFRKFSEKLEAAISELEKALLYVHWGIFISVASLLSLLFHRSFRMVLLVSLGLLLIVNLGLWEEMIQTLLLVTISSLVAMAIGVPLGILSSRYPYFYLGLRPILDLMQTVPTFVYLIPTLMLFGLGIVPGLISTIIFAISAPIRMTYLGIRSVPAELIEASDAFGATKMQRLFKVELPFAKNSLRAGLTQCIMLSLSMVVIAALVGAKGLGTPVVRALNTVDIASGFEAGLAIVILAILLDRSLSRKNIFRKDLK